jgi:hypothetical protein
MKIKQERMQLSQIKHLSPLNMRVVVVKTMLVAACASLLVICSGCEATLYPAARAFGSPSERELVSCRAHLREMQSSLPKAKLIIHPPCVITRSGGRWETNATARVVEALKSKGFEDVVAEDSLSSVPVRVPGPNQLRFTWQRAHAYSAWARGAKLGPGWHVFADFVVLDDQLAGLGIYVTDADGHLALVRIMNSHQSGWKVGQPGLIESGCDMLIEILLQIPKMSPERLYPPYGIG